MTDTTRPPNRPHPSRPRPSGRAGKPDRGSGDTRRDDARRDPTAKARGDEPVPPKDDARIAKVMARAGLCSRRDAEGWIAAGRVAVNGAVIDSPALNVAPGDTITVDGVPLPDREQTRLFLFHKPRGLVTTARDPEGRPTIFDNLPEGLPRVVSVGRLDINTEGLMLLTNDGGLARVLELPATGWMRRYRVRANGTVDPARLDALKAGVTIDGIDYAGIEATLDRVQGANVWLTMGLREGKNREIKRVLEALGLAVTRLIRLSFGPFQLGELPEGAVEAVPTRVLREQLGPGLAAQAGADLEPREEAPVRRQRPSRADPSAPRPHVGALRAAREEAAGEGRHRIQRGATADRKGRAVAVERVVPVRTGAERDAPNRNARRFAAERQERDGQKTRGETGRPKRFGAAGPARRGDDPRRGEETRRGDDTRRGEETRRGDDTRPARGGGEQGFAPKRFVPKSAAAAGRAGRAPTGERAERAPRADRFGPAPAERAPERSRGDRASGDRASGDRASGDRGFAGRGAADRGSESRGFGDRPRSGKPNGRPGGFSSERPVTGRNKGESGRPSGDRPSGGKPFGAKPFRGRPSGDRPSGGKPFGGQGPDGKPRGGAPRGGKPAGRRP